MIYLRLVFVIKAYSLPDIVLSCLGILSFNLLNNPIRYYYYLHFMDEETKTQTGVWLRKTLTSVLVFSRASIVLNSCVALFTLEEMRKSIA